MSSTGESGGHDHAKSCKCASGAAKRKAKEERLSRESKVLSKVPKISEMFSPTATSRVGDSAGDAPCKSTDAQDLQLLQFDESVSTELTTSTEVSTRCSTWTTTVPEKPDKSTELVTADNRLSSSNDNSDGFACDLGMWPVEISDSMREYWAVKGSGDCGNSKADFSKTSTRFEGDSYNRQCQKSLFTYTHELTKQQHP